MSGHHQASALRQLGRPALLALADALRAGGLAAPYTAANVAPKVPADHTAAVAHELAEMHADGMAPRHIARCLDLLAAERAETQRMTDRLQLVWSPADLDHVDARDTPVVVQDLFAKAEHSLLIVTFALDEGQKAHDLFGKLAERMDANAALQVRLVANIHRPHHDTTPAAQLVAAFAKRFRENIWPGHRLPDLYHYPRSLETDGGRRSVLHAKCIVADNRWTLLTSANFTEAAHQRNIEAGLLVDDGRLAARISQQVDRLVEAGSLVSVST